MALLSYRGNMFCGGQGVYLVNLARALIKAGARVTVVSGPPWHDEVEGARNVRVPNHNFINKGASSLPVDSPLSVFSPLNLAEYTLARAGSNPEMMAFSLRCFGLLRRLHLADPIDVVHDNQGLGYGLPLIRLLGVPVLATIHHPLQVDRAEDVLQTEGLAAKFKRTVYYPPVMQGLVAKSLDRIVTVSAFSRDLIARAYGLDKTQMEVVYNGVDSDFFRPTPGLERERGALLFVGSTEDRKKGIAYLLRALAGLPPDRFWLTVVDGRRYPGRVYAANLVSRLGLTGRVIFKDKITNDELRLEYGRAEMTIVPSLFEGFGLPALEAMACGSPLISTQAGALPEVCGAAAEMVPPRSASAIQRAVLKLDADASLRARTSKAGLERARSVFTWDAAAARTLDLYRQAMSSFKG